MPTNLKKRSCRSETTTGICGGRTSYTRHLEKDNAVYIEIEFVALSRSVPRIVAWLVNPYIRSVPSEYLTNYGPDR
jgi:hypothetical protein